MRKSRFVAKVFLLNLFLTLLVLSAFSQAPIIFRLSDAVKPGELITVYGEGLTPSGIEVAVDATTADQPSGSSTMLEVVSPDPEGHYVTAILKETLPAGVFNLWVKNAEGWSNALLLNAARPQWLSIDQVAAGLKVKVVGKNLDGLEFGAGRSTRVKLVNNASEYNANVLTVNPYAVEFTVSASVPQDSYNVLVSNNGGAVWKGLESDQKLTVVQKGDDPLGLGVAWAKDFNWSWKYNVKDYGAVGDGTTNETAAIQAAVDAVKTAGGGVVYLPVGTYKTTSIQLPADVVLLGESRENTILSFANSTSANFITAKNDGITNGRTGIANLKIGIDMNNPSQIYPDHFIWLGNNWGSGLTSITFTRNRTAEKIFIKDVTLDFPTDARGGGRAYAYAIYANQYMHISGMVVKGWRARSSSVINKYSEISDCDFECTNQGLIANAANMYTVMERNSIKFNNSLTDKTVERGYEVTSHSYLAYNNVENSSGTDNWNEQINIEPRDGKTKMYGTITSATSTTVAVNPRKDGDVLYGYNSFSDLPAIAQQNNWSLEYNKYPQGWYITITDGRGLGQYRKVVSLNETISEVGIDKPWDVIPDSTSKFVISVPALNNVAYKNTFKNGSKPLLGYQNLYDNVFADNYSEDTQGNNIMNYYVMNGVNSTSFAISYFNRMVNNTSKGVSMVRGTSGIGYHFFLELYQATDENAFAYTCYGMDIKNNYVRSVLPAPQPNTRETPPVNGIYLGSYLRAGQGNKNAIKGGTIENNIIRDSNRGISIGGTLYPYWTFEPRANTTPMSYGIVVKSNRFMNVTDKIVDNTTAAQKTVFIDNGDIDDQMPPVTTAQITGNKLGDIYTGDVRMRLTATDSVSGVKSTEYSLDMGVTWKAYELPVVFTDEGSYMIRYRSTDRIENLEQAKSLNFTIGSPSGEVTETFDTEATTTANGWTGNGNKTVPNNYGWENTDVVLGEGTGGAAGGVFARRIAYSYFADTNTGTFARTDTLRLAGSFRMRNDNFDGNFYLGYFNPSDPGNNFVGLCFAEPSGGGNNPFRGFASVDRLTNSAAVVELPQDTTLTFDLVWTGSADGSGTLSGTLAGQSVSVEAGAGTGTFSAFGLLNGGASSNSSEKTGNCYFDNLAYRTLAPMPPANLRADVSLADTSVTLTWDYGSTLASGFVISRDGVAIGDVTTNSFTDQDVVPGTTYQYSVHAYNEFGNSGSATLKVYAGAPANLSANIPVGATSVILSWDYGSGLEIGFVISRDGVAMDTVSTKTFTDRNVVPGTSYEYSVHAYNESVNSSSASLVVYVMSIPPDPSNLRAKVSPGATSVTLTWDYESGLATGFVISRDGVVLGDVSSKTFTDYDFLQETSYEYSVYAYNELGNSGAAKLSFFFGSLAGEVTETFDTEATTTDNGWTGNGNKTAPNNYGWANADDVLGVGTGGAAGGVFSRRIDYSYFADTKTGTFDRTDTLRLAGSFRLVNINFDGTFYLGYFNISDPNNTFMGLTFVEPTGGAGNPFRGYAGVAGADGAGTGIIELIQNTTLAFDLTWTGSVDGSGTFSGMLAGQNVNVSVGAGTGTFSAFGLLNGGMSSNSSQKTGNCYFDNLTYRKQPLITYTVSYDANGGEGIIANDTKTHDVDLALSDGSGFSRTGYTLSGWNSAADGSGTNYAAGAKYTINAGQTFFAKWTANTYSVTYGANGGTGTIADATKTHDVDLILSDGSGLTRAGYTFSGWNTWADGTGTAYAANYNYSGNADLSLYAMWAVDVTSVVQGTIEGISIYPNPTSDRIYFKNLHEDSRIVLVDLTGRTILEKKASELNHGLSIQPYANGYYLIKVVRGNENTVLRYIKK